MRHDLLALLGRERLPVGEVEAQLVGTNRRARLLHVVAEDVAQRLVEEVRRRVVRHRREADLPGDDGLDAVARREAFAVEEEHLVLADPIRLFELGARARLLVLDEARRRSPGRRPAG